jgi:hypothetical protein
MSSTLIIVVVIAVVGYFVYTNGWLDNLNLPFSISGGDSGNMVDVNKKLQFTWTAEYSGTVANAKTFYIYDESNALRETLTTAATGIVASAQNYPSGTHISVKYDDTNNQIWYDLVVPQMNVHDSESNTYNDIALKYYAIGTYTSDSFKVGGTSFTDADALNCSASGNGTVTPSISYDLTNTGADNTGLLESYDPIYASAWDVWVTGTISGTNPELVIVNGVDYQWVVGTTTYFADKVSASELSKWRIGSNLVPGYEGKDGVSFSLDATNFVGGATATLQIEVYECADPVYAMSHAGNFGHDKVEIAEHTIDLVTTA